MSFGNVEELVRLEHAEFGGQADQHLDEQWPSSVDRRIVAQRDDGLQVQYEFVLAQRLLDELEQVRFTFRGRDVLGQLVVRTHVFDTQARDHRGVVGGRIRRIGFLVPETAAGLGQHRQHRRECADPFGAIFLAGGQTREHDQHHAAEMTGIEQGERTTCAGGIRALPPQAAGWPAHVVRFFDDRLLDRFCDQRVVLREQEIPARPERMPLGVMDRQGKDFGSAAHEAARQRREHRIGCFMIGRKLRHRWPAD
jgi:hypothetical protein